MFIICFDVKPSFDCVIALPFCLSVHVRENLETLLQILGSNDIWIKDENDSLSCQKLEWYFTNQMKSEFAYDALEHCKCSYIRKRLSVFASEFKPIVPDQQ